MEMNTRRQPQRIPPPIDHGDESVEGELILRELAGDLGVVVWKTARSVRLWAELTPRQRAGAFNPDAHVERVRLIRSLDTKSLPRAELERLADVLRGGKLSGEQVAETCASLSAWAEAAGACATALELMQAAAFASPRNAMLALSVGRLARDRSEYARSETWFRQAITAARQTRDRKAFAKGFLGLGTVAIRRGNYAAARKSFTRVLRIGQRYSLRSAVAEAYSELMGVAVGSNRPAEVVRYARSAISAYGAGHPYIPVVAYDLAVFWVARGHFAAAIEIIRALPAQLLPPTMLLGRASSLALAGAGAGDDAAYKEGAKETNRLLRAERNHRDAVASLVDLTHAAALRGDWDVAEQFIRRAGKEASKSGAVRLREVEALAESVRARKVAHPAPVAPTRNVERLVEALTDALHPPAAV